MYMLLEYIVAPSKFGLVIDQSVLFASMERPLWPYFYIRGMGEALGKDYPVSHWLDEYISNKWVKLKALLEYMKKPKAQDKLWSISQNMVQWTALPGQCKWCKTNAYHIGYVSFMTFLSHHHTWNVIHWSSIRLIEKIYWKTIDKHSLIVLLIQRYEL